MPCMLLLNIIYYVHTCSWITSQTIWGTLFETFHLSKELESMGNANIYTKSHQLWRTTEKQWVRIFEYSIVSTGHVSQLNKSHTIELKVKQVQLTVIYQIKNKFSNASKFIFIKKKFLNHLLPSRGNSTHLMCQKKNKVEIQWRNAY